MKPGSILWLFTLLALAASAQDDLVSKDTLIDLLTGDSISRGIVAQERQDPAGMSVDLSINFEFDSAILTSESKNQLDALLSALLDARMESFAFSIIGHTDAKGDQFYNRELSRRRAQSVQRYLVEGGVTEERLMVAGKGEDELLYPHRPADAANRRVEVINEGAIDQ